LPKRKLPILKSAKVVTRRLNISPILLRQIARDMRITAEELVDA
jgi:hypothetical protein